MSDEKFTVTLMTVNHTGNNGSRMFVCTVDAIVGVGEKFKTSVRYFVFTIKTVHNNSRAGAVVGPSHHTSKLVSLNNLDRDVIASSTVSDVEKKIVV